MSRSERFFSRYVAPCALSKWARLLTLLLYLTIIGISILFAKDVRLGIQKNYHLRQNSDELAYNNKRYEHFNYGANLVTIVEDMELEMENEVN